MPVSKSGGKCWVKPLMCYSCYGSTGVLPKFASIVDYRGAAGLPALPTKLKLVDDDDNENTVNWAFLCLKRPQVMLQVAGSVRTPPMKLSKWLVIITETSR